MDDPLPHLPSFDRWVGTPELREYVACSCFACYKWHVLDDRVMMSAAHDDRRLDKLWKESKEDWLKNCVSIPKVKHHVGNGKLNGTWAGTLTMSTDDATNEGEMLTAVKRLFTQQTSPVEKYAWYLEYTKNGTPHIHFIYRTPTGSRILPKVFKRVWRYWDERTPVGAGHRGGYHRIIHDEEAYLAYIGKDGGVHASNW